MPEIRRLDLWEAYSEALKLHKDTSVVMIAFVKDKIGAHDSATPDWEVKVKEVLKKFIEKCNNYYKSSAVNYHKEIFLKKRKDWLSQHETFPTPAEPSPEKNPASVLASCSQPSTSKVGRGRPKESNFMDLEESSKRKRTKSFREDKETNEIAYATEMKLRSEGNTKAAKLVKKVVEASPRTVNMIFIVVDKIKRTDSGNIDDGSPKDFSEAEAVVHQIECDFTKDQYNLNRKRLIEKNCQVFPSYEKITEYKKQCVPNNLKITEQKAGVTLQDQLNHTTSRIVAAQEDVFKTESITGTKLELVSKIGFDASSNHSRYNQVWKQIGADDSTMVLTALVPLLLHQNVGDQGKVNILWMNRKPSSTVYCRPLELEFIKETAAFIKLKAQELNEAINNLEVTLVEVNGDLYEVCHRVILSMIDGKVSSAITETGSATCNVCKATPSQMNDIDAVLKRDCDQSALQYGLSVLHLYIRFLEYYLNVAKRLKVAEKCYGKYTKEQLTQMDTRHKSICQRLKNELGLIIDQPSSKGGNTNTGNNARRFFENSEKVSEITGLDLNILQNTSIVLKTLSCGYAINTQIFSNFSVQLARDLVHENRYKFWCMPAAVHLALIHGAAIMEALPVPIGMLSEEPLESSHKVVRYLRLHHTRKVSRESTMTDLFKALQIQTDPIIASLRRPPKAKGSLDARVVQMLIGSDDQPPIQRVVEVMDEENSDIDDPE